MILHGNRGKSRLARLIRPRVTAESEGRRQAYGSTVRRSGHKRRLGSVSIDNLAIAGHPVSDAKTIPSGIHTRHVARFGNGTIRGRPNREKPKTFEYIICCLIFRQFCWNRIRTKIIFNSVQFVFFILFWVYVLSPVLLRFYFPYQRGPNSTDPVHGSLVSFRTFPITTGVGYI